MAASGIPGQFTLPQLKFADRNFALCLLAAIVIHAIAAWSNVGYLHADEHFQIIEFANFKLGNITATDLPWEWQREIRPGLQPLIAWFTVTGLSLAGATSPFSAALFLRLASGLLALVACLTLTAEASRWAGAAKQRAVLLAALCLFWCMPIIHVRFSSENWSGAFLAIGICLVLRARRSAISKRELAMAITAGLAFGLAFFLRFQIGFAVAGVLAWLVFDRASSKTFSGTAIGLSLGLLAGVAADYWLYGHFVLTPLNYWQVNLVEGRAESFGTSPWWYYPGALSLLLIPPFSLPLLGAIAIACVRQRRHVLVWAFVPFVLVHCVVAHKEVRFLFPMFYLLPALVLMATPAQGFLSGWRPLIAWPLAAFALINSLILAIAISIPAHPIGSVQAWLYLRADGREVSLWHWGRSPWEKAGLVMHFYKPGTVTLQKVSNPAAMRLVIQADRVERLVMVEEYELPSALANEDCQRVYSVVPEAARSLLPARWFENYRVWSIYECRGAT